MLKNVWTLFIYNHLIKKVAILNWWFHFSNLFKNWIDTSILQIKRIFLKINCWGKNVVKLFDGINLAQSPWPPLITPLIENEIFPILGWLNNSRHLISSRRKRLYSVWETSLHKTKLSFTTYTFVGSYRKKLFSACNYLIFIHVNYAFIL